MEYYYSQNASYYEVFSEIRRFSNISLPPISLQMSNSIATSETVILLIVSSFSINNVYYTLISVLNLISENVFNF